VRHIVLILICLLTGAPLSVTAAPDSAAFQSLLDREWAFREKEFPGLAEDSGNDAYAGELTQNAPADFERRYKAWQGMRSELEAISCARLEPSECLDYRLFRRQLDGFIADYETGAWMIPINSDWSFYSGWARMSDPSKFAELKNYQDYVSRLEQLPRAMDQYLSVMRQGIDKGFVQPKVVMAGRDGPIRAQITDGAADNPYYAPFAAQPERVDPVQWSAQQQRAAEAIGDGVIPAYERLLAFMQDEYLPAARDTLGASELPGGERFYREQIRWYATVDMSPQEIHDLGLAEVARIRAEMDAIITELGFEGSFAEFLAFLRSDPQFYANSPRELLAEASYVAKKVDGQLPQFFGRLPRQPYGVAPVPEDIAPFFTAGRYIPAPLDARRGGYYWVNTHALESRPLYALPALTLHEAAPGHHLQGALALELDEQPAFRRNDYISAYGEGWALYAEKLGVEMGIYETPYEHFGRLTYEMWRAARLVIDTGIHAMGWTRQQALDYLAGHTALSDHEVTIEVDRYINTPAQALAYKLGERLIRAKRADAEARLGDDFDQRWFHDVILGLGSVPLPTLARVLDEWIADGGKDPHAAP
jgi:uncharacterized protein (DUF885 family)